MTVATAASKNGLKADNIIVTSGSSDPTHSQKRHQSHWLKHDQQQQNQQQLTGSKQTADFLSPKRDNTASATEARGRRNAAEDPAVVVKDCGTKTCGSSSSGGGTPSSRTKSSTSSSTVTSNGYRKSSSTMRPPNSASKPTTRPMAGGAGMHHPKIPKYAR